MKATNMLAGKKTYVVGALMIAYALAGYLLGEVEAAEAGRLFLEGAGFGALRAGIAKVA